MNRFLLLAGLCLFFSLAQGRGPFQGRTPEQLCGMARDLGLSGAMEYRR